MNNWAKSELSKIDRPRGGDLNAQIDEAYCQKYRTSPYLSLMIGAR